MIDAIIVPLAPSVQTKTSLATLASGTLACRAQHAPALSAPGASVRGKALAQHRRFARLRRREAVAQSRGTGIRLCRGPTGRYAIEANETRKVPDAAQRASWRVSSRSARTVFGDLANGSGLCDGLSPKRLRAVRRVGDECDRPQRRAFRALQGRRRCARDARAGSRAGPAATITACRGEPRHAAGSRLEEQCGGGGRDDCSIADGAVRRRRWLRLFGAVNSVPGDGQSKRLSPPWERLGRCFRSGLV
jgi:hypothetical protein